MIKWLILLLSLVCSNAWATVAVVRYPSGTPVQVCQASDSNPSCGGGGGSGTVTQVNTSSPLTGGPITTTGTIGITKADTSTDGYLSSTDWNTFNSKTLLSGLTTNKIPKATSSSSIGDSLLFENGGLAWNGTTIADSFTLYANGAYGHGMTIDDVPGTAIGLLLHFENNFTDSSASGKTITNNGGNVTFSNTIFEVGAYSAFFQGNNSTYLSTPHSSDFDFTGNFTVDFWFYPTNLTATTQSLLGDYNFTSGTTGWGIFCNSSHVIFDYNTSALLSSSAPTANAWNHVVVQRVGSTITMYIGGVSVGTSTSAASISNSNTFYIGNNPDLVRNYQGYIDEMSVGKGTIADPALTLSSNGTIYSKIDTLVSSGLQSFTNNGHIYLTSSSAGVVALPLETTNGFCKSSGGVGTIHCTDTSTYLTGTKADSVSNSDGTLTISPTTGAVVASLALGHANTWTGKQIFNTSSVQIGTLSASSVVFTDASKNLTSTGLGTSSQFIKGDGSLDSNTYLITVDKFTKAMTVDTAATNFGGI